MAKADIPVTPAVRFLRERNVSFIPHFYKYQDKGGTRASSEALGIPEHLIIKTLVLESEERKPVIVLMHGDCEVSVKQLARFLSVKRLEPASEPNGMRYTGYQFGGTSPFGTRMDLPVYVEQTIFDYPAIYLNGGKRGFLVEISPSVLSETLPVTRVNVAVSRV